MEKKEDGRKIFLMYYGGASQPIVVYPGTSSKEIFDLVKVVFNIPGNEEIYFVDDEGVPIACSSSMPNEVSLYVMKRPLFSQTIRPSPPPQPAKPPRVPTSKQEPKPKPPSLPTAPSLPFRWDTTRNHGYTISADKLSVSRAASLQGQPVLVSDTPVREGIVSFKIHWSHPGHSVYNIVGLVSETTVKGYKVVLPTFCFGPEILRMPEHDEMLVSCTIDMVRKQFIMTEGTVQEVLAIPWSAVYVALCIKNSRMAAILSFDT